MKLICKPTFGPYSRIIIQLPDIQLPDKSSLVQGKKIMLNLRQDDNEE